ncbi:MAG: AI-2E family transporter, partial [Nanoarchaeota archaeon]|nr:AI-2E family transporter [Nanoarchaeota archaeon]
YKWVKKGVKNENIASLIVSILAVLLLIIPLFFVLNTITKEAYVGYLLSKQKMLEAGNLLDSCDPLVNPACKPIEYVGNFFSDSKVRYHLENTIERVTSYIVDTASNLVFSIPKFILNFFVMIFTMFYLFKDGAKAFKDLRKLLPLRDVYKQHLFEKFGKVTYAIVYGYVVVAIIQGVFGAIGFFIFGIQSPIIWGIVMAFAALIPFLGTGIIWIPAALIKLFNGILAGNSSEIIGGVLFILYGTIIISGIDNILRPKIIGDKAKVHPVLILTGVLGGLFLFGFIGAIVGPLVLALFATFIKAYEKDKASK